jgi:succinate dehydrogenase/fumarate reductase-like Fe-S protein
MRNLKVKIFRFDPAKDKEPYYQTYFLPFDGEEPISLMNVLDYIYENMDTSLAYFNHAACRQGVCGRCFLKMNGKTVLACQATAQGPEILLEPARPKVLKDLISE